MAAPESSPARRQAARNRPGLPGIAYRLGTHSSFLRSMLERLPGWQVPDGPNQGAQPLLNLNRAAGTDDPAIALLDLSACVADVLTFYQERIANEGYLRTAAERRSVLALARAIGYEFDLGVAASTYLAFVVEEAAGAPGQAEIAQGVRVLSIPPPGKLPLTFETQAPITARKEWNNLKPRLTRPQKPVMHDRQATLQGVDTGLQPGDHILFVGQERAFDRPTEEFWDVRKLMTVTPNPQAGTTTVTWLDGLGQWPAQPAANPECYIFRARTALFGHNAANWTNLPPAIQALYPDGKTEWPEFKIKTITKKVNNQPITVAEIDLDGVYQKILINSWVALVQPKYVELYKAIDIQTVSRADFGMSAKLTRIVTDVKENIGKFGLRNTFALAQSEQAALAEIPITTPVFGKSIELATYAGGLETGRALLLTGRRMRAMATADLTLTSLDGLSTQTVKSGEILFINAKPQPKGLVTLYTLADRTGFIGRSETSQVQILSADPADPLAAEVAILASASHAANGGESHTTLSLLEDLVGYYDRTTVSINANAVLATHGETVNEPLGSGNGSLANQRFTLRKPPLTYTPAANLSGAETSLDVRVDGLLWTEQPSLYNQPSGARVYSVRVEDDGQTTVTFGDGLSGARLPTGAQNVTAVYRSGTGLVGETAANTLTILQTRPLGVRSVNNPLPASGAADPETLDDARQKATGQVLALERIVSLKDYQAFTAAYAGVGKAQAVELWNGESRVVHLTVATARGEPLDPGSLLYENLLAAIKAARESELPLIIQGFKRIYFKLESKVLVDRAYSRPIVLNDIMTRVQSAYTFNARQFGQAVTSAEVIGLIQSTQGVIAADVDALYREDMAPATLPPANAVLTARPAKLINKVYYPAELLLLHPLWIEPGEMTS